MQELAQGAAKEMVEFEPESEALIFTADLGAH